jgi:hypothetical protein
MRAKEIWALVPVPSHVVKKVVSACLDRHVDFLRIPNYLWCSGGVVTAILGCRCQVQKGSCSQERVREGDVNPLPLLPSILRPFVPTLLRVRTDNAFLPSSIRA